MPRLTPLVLLKRQAITVRTELNEIPGELKADDSAPYASECLDSALEEIERAILWIEQAAKCVNRIKSR